MNLNLNIKKTEGHDKGFTLLELLIVVSIIAILSVALVVILDPAEALRKSRDAQRISDMNTMKTAIGLYLTSTSTPYLGSATSTPGGCKATPATVWASSHRVFYSYNATTTAATAEVAGAGYSTAYPSLTDGNGWIPVNFDTLTGGSPISNLPLDPVNTIVTPAAPVNSDLVYRYACSITPLAFEIDAKLESTAYASSSPTTDGGNNSSLYEVGTNLKILDAAGNF